MSRNEQDMLGMCQPRRDRRVIRSPGDDVCVVLWSEWSQSYDESERSLMLRKMANIMCEWSHSYDESGWSLMTSLIRRFGVPYE